PGIGDRNGRRMCAESRRGKARSSGSCYPGAVTGHDALRRVFLQRASDIRTGCLRSCVRSTTYVSGAVLAWGAAACRLPSWVAEPEIRPHQRRELIAMLRSIQAIAAAVGFVVAGAFAHAAPIYYNVFNVEAENEFEAAFVTYDTLEDMFNDENRTGLFIADGVPPFGRNIVGSGSDGVNYWNVFNVE